MKNQTAAVFAVIFGSLYTMSRKFQCVIPLNDDGKQFNQPMLQTFIIFIGMTSIFFFRPFIPTEPEMSQKKKQSKYAYIIPSMLDVIGTISDTAGLYYTSVSVSQMLKGSTLFFTYLITVLCFKAQLKLKQHLYMIVIVASLGLIGYSNTTNTDLQYESRPVLGNLLIILSQFAFALMFITEQKITKKYNMQIKNAVLWQGIWGVLISGVLVIVFSNMSFSSFQKSDKTISSIIVNIFHCDFSKSCSMIFSNYKLFLAMLVTGLCIGPFNYFGLLITKNTSALQRCMICTSRMITVWLASLLFKWEQYNVLQFVGYVILSYSIYEYNKLENTKQIANQIHNIHDESERIFPISQQQLQYQSNINNTQTDKYTKQ